MSAVAKQCKSCPWRVDCDPDKDIPGGYSRKLHADLAGTIRIGLDSMIGGLRAMACHYSAPGKETPCAGWLENQIGEGNNIGARLAVITGQWPAPEVDGEQHARFEDTLPGSAKSPRKRSRR